MLGAPTPRPDSTDPRNRRSHRGRGQSLAEFAVLVPVLLAFAGLLIDATRVYQAYLNFESAMRDTAQYLATSHPDPCDDNHSGQPPAGSGCTPHATSDQKAAFLLGLSTNTTFTISSSQTTCTDPLVTTTYSENTSASAGGSAAYPVGIATVKACLPFRMLFDYPFITNGGNWVLRSEQTYRSLVGR